MQNNKQRTRNLRRYRGQRVIAPSSIQRITVAMETVFLPFSGQRYATLLSKISVLFSSSLHQAQPYFQLSGQVGRLFMPALRSAALANLTDIQQFERQLTGK